MNNDNAKNIVKFHFQSRHIGMTISCLLAFILLFFEAMSSSNDIKEFKIFSLFFNVYASFAIYFQSFMKKNEKEIYMISGCTRKDINLSKLFINLILSFLLISIHIVSFISILIINSNLKNVLEVMLDSFKIQIIIISIILFFTDILNTIDNISSKGDNILKIINILWILLFVFPPIIFFPIFTLFKYIYSYSNFLISIAIYILTIIIVYFIGKSINENMDL